MGKSFSITRILAFLIAIALILPMVPASSFAIGTVDFSDDSSTPDLQGWVSHTTGKIENGAYILPADSINYVAQKNYERVAISADVQIYTSVKENGFTTGTTAYVFARGNESNQTGYDFGIGVHNDGQTYVRLYRRDVNGVSKMLYQSTEAIPEIGFIQTGTIYNIQLATTEDLVLGYINGNLVVSAKDSSFSSGAVGIRTLDGEAKFDNVNVMELPERKAESISIVEHDTDVSLVGKVHFKGQVQYNSVYGTEEFDQDTEGVTLTGLDGKVGAKTITVSYLDKTAQFDIQVNEKYKSTVIYEDDFSELDESWNGGVSQYADYGLEYKFTFNGTASVTAPSAYGADIPMNVVLSRPEDEMEEQKYYSVKATAYILGDSKTPTVRKGTAVLQFAKDAETGAIYELRLDSSGLLSVYCGSTLLTSRSLPLVTGDTFGYGRAYTLSAELYDNVAVLTVNGKLICYFAGFSADNPVGYAGLKVIAGSVKFDNYLAQTIEEKRENALKNIQVYSVESGSNVGNSELYYFNNSDYFVVGQYIDGSTMPVHLSKTIISDYYKTSSALQRITVTYGGKSCVINYAYKPYLFYDAFDGYYSSRWNLPTNQYLTYEIQNEWLTFSYTNSTGNSGIIGYVPDGTEWTNYAVSADVFFNVDGVPKNRYLSLVGRLSGTSRYEYRLIYGTNGKMTGALYRFDSGSAVLLQNISEGQLKSCLNKGELLGTGNKYHMTMSLVGNMIKLYLNDTLVISYEDTSANALYKGSAGIRVINNPCMIDNFIVERKDNARITGFGLSEFPEGDVFVWQGNDIALWDNKLVVHYADGTSEKTWLKPNMLGAFANTELGTHSVDITYGGATFPISITVKERSEYIKSFTEQLSTFGSTVDASNLQSFMQLKGLYDDLSPYEASSISADLTLKYNELLHQYDLYIAPELIGDTLQVNSTMQTNIMDTWGASIEGTGGKWMQSNSLIYHAQIPYGISLTGWKCPDIYGNISGISADLRVLNDGMYAGVGINVGADGYYHARIANVAVDENNETLYQVQLYRKTSAGHRQIAAIYPASYDIILDNSTWFNLMMTIEGNTIRVYLDGVSVIEYEESDKLFVIGGAGLRISQGDALIDNVRVYGTTQSVEERDSSLLVNPTTYQDDFEDEVAGEDPSHWVENYTSSHITDNWKVYDYGSKVYGTRSSGNTQTYLYAFEHNPTITAKLMVEKMAADGHFGFITRMAPSTAFTFVGYDAALKMWYVKSQATEVEGAQVNYQEGEFLLETNKWYDVKLTLKGETLSLVIDGEEVLTADSVRHTGYGRFGFYTENASLFVDDYTVVMASGDIPQEGVISYVIDEDVYNNFFEIETFDDGQNLIGVGKASKFVSKNAGLTWTDVTKSETYEQTKTSSYTTLLKMSNGKYMQILGGNEMEVQISDDLLNWTSVSKVVPSEDVYAPSGSAITIIHVNNATEVTLSNGTKRIFVPISYRKYNSSNSVLGHYTKVYFTDDFGTTWQHSANTTLDVLPGDSITTGYTWAESKVIACADGSLRMYYSRNYLGCMQYTVSYDDGVTWEGLYQIPEIQLPMTSFAVMEDPTVPGTYYMVCCVGKTNYLGAVYPRTRFVLLKSTDGMNWDFQMNIERMSSYNSIQNGVPLYQILDPSLLITEDYVYITIGRSEREYSENDANSHQAQRIYYVRVEKDKLQSRAWDASTIADMYYPKTVTIEQSPQTVFGLADLFVCEGTVKLTDFLGNETIQPISESCTVYQEPDMFNLGQSKVHMRYQNGFDLSYDITVKNYKKITWDIYGEGTVEPNVSRLYEGETETFTFVPADGWKLTAVYIGEEQVQLTDGKLVLSNLTDNVEVIVLFEQQLFVEQPWFWIVVSGGAVLIVGAVVTLILIGKKKKKGHKKDVSGKDEV